MRGETQELEFGWLGGPGRLWLRRIGFSEAWVRTVCVIWFCQLFPRILSELVVRADALGTSMYSTHSVL